MKKTLFALLVCAAVAQAASLNWTIKDVKEAKEGGSTDNATIGSYSAYLFVTANTTNVQLTLANETEILDVLSGGDISSICTTIASASAVNKTNNTAGAWTGSTGLSEFSTGSLTAFAVIFDAANVAEANNYFVVSGGETSSVTFTNATSAKILSFGNQADASGAGIGAAGSWQSLSSATTPEPATATLSLLALAGLAARRRH